MPIKSFIAFPAQNQKEQMITDLSAMEECEVLPAKNEEVVILVTDTNSEEEEKALINTINDLPTVDQISMVSGYEAN
mgnify:CR=1 FL=1